MIRLSSAILCEGTYDKIRLSNIFDAQIITTDGFAIRNNKEKIALLKILSKEQPVILVTDPDKAGFAIRHFLAQTLGQDRVRHVFVPDVYGKERRKEKAAKEGKLGVEGLPDEVIVEAFRQAGLLEEAPAPKRDYLTSQRLYADRLLGCPEAAERRRAFAALLSLPARLSRNMFCQTVSRLLSEAEYEIMLQKLDESENKKTV